MKMKEMDKVQTPFGITRIIGYDDFGNVFMKVEEKLFKITQAAQEKFVKVDGVWRNSKELEIDERIERDKNKGELI